MFRRAAAVLGVFALLGCRRGPELNVMRQPAACDTVPPQLAPGEASGGRVPRALVSAAEGVVVGTVTEAGTGRPLSSAGVTLFRGAGSERRQVGREVATDAAGGFALGSAVAGVYTLRVRAIQHTASERPVVLLGGVADTIHLRMRYFRCVGY